MLDGLKRARIYVQICEEILSCSTVENQKDVTLGLENAYQNTLKSIEVLYFEISEVINMEKAHESHRLDPLQQLITDALK